MYIIVRIPDGFYVARPGNVSSYTRDLKQARLYVTKAEAERDLCPENERISTVHDEMGIR
jgi:hypothetical protein